MRATRAPTLRDLHQNAARPASKLRARRDDAWIFEDPDLAPAPRHETPLTAWA